MSDIADIEALPLSSSVRSAIRHFGNNERINSWEIVSEILKLHPEYARHMGEKLHGVGVQPKGESKTLDEWLNGLSAFFDLGMVRQRVGVINGRLAIWGLARLDPELKSYLDSYEFLSALEQEYREEKKAHPSELVRPFSSQQDSPSIDKTQSDVSQRIQELRAIDDISERIDKSIELIPDLSGELQTRVVQEALGDAISIQEDSARAKALIQLLPYLPEVIRQSLAQEVLDTAIKIPDLSFQANIISRLLPHLPESIRQSTLQAVLIIIEGIKDSSSRAGAISQLVPYLTENERNQFELSKDIQPERDSTDSKKTEPAHRPKISPVYLPPVAGYTSDRINEESRDMLNIEREVANIANILTFKQVQPPLALGLFGDWGSGKSFFMGKLRKYVSQVASHYQREEQDSESNSMWCSRVAQIEFNAWHFSDSNLWASLVTRIYEGLDRELNREKETADDIKKKIIEAQIKEAKEKSIKAESQLDLAKTRVNSAQENLKQKSKEREQKENTLLGMISNIPDLLKDTEFEQPLQDAAVSLGMPEAAKTYEALEELNGELKSVSGRLTAVTASILHSPWTLLGMTFFIVILPVIFTLAIESWGVFLTEAGRRVAEVSAFLMFIVSWLRAQVRRGLSLVAVVERALQEARKIRQTKIEKDKDVMEARKALTEAQAEEQAARTNLEIAQTELERLQLELQELRPERKLQRLIEMRASTGAYAQHLGIISLIRSDFESMSRILAEMVDERRDFKNAPPIQRIILYIDDLDRCKPERVVEVLEAIHLLLFFPLFVVVVAVDPRWLRHSLSHHYPATLNEQARVSSIDGISGISLYSTPQDYLEKIFQIPFALRPVEKGGYQSLVNDLLKPLPVREQREESEASMSPANAQTEKTLNIRIDAIGDEGTKDINQQMRASSATSFTPIPPRQLEFTEWEKEDIQRLWLMFRTPRTVKRFINIYRLLRAGLVSKGDVKRFEGTKRKPGEYQVALLLLAATTAFPNEASRLLYQLDAWLDIQESKNSKGQYNWQVVIDYLKKESNPSWVSTNREQIDQGNNVIGTVPTNNIQDVMGTWKLMLDCLDQVTQDNAWKKPFNLPTLRFWVIRVARFSFSVQPT
jgi:hypothetical protein